MGIGYVETKQGNKGSQGLQFTKIASKSRNNIHMQRLATRQKT
jgi:hypothetical protein